MSTWMSAYLQSFDDDPGDNPVDNDYAQLAELRKLLDKNGPLPFETYHKEDKPSYHERCLKCGNTFPDWCETCPKCGNRQ